MAEDGDYLAVKDAALAAGVPERTVRHWVRRGKLPAREGPRGHVVRLADVRGVAHLAGYSRPDSANSGNGAGEADLAVDLAGFAEVEAAAALAAVLADELAATRATIAAKDAQIVAQAEELGALRERVRLLEAPQPPPHDEPPRTPAPAGWRGLLWRLLGL